MAIHVAVRKLREALHLHDSQIRSTEHESDEDRRRNPEKMRSETEIPLLRHETLTLTRGERDLHRPILTEKSIYSNPALKGGGVWSSPSLFQLWLATSLGFG